MSNSKYRFGLIAIALLLIKPVWALSVEEAKLLRKDYQLYQLWSLGRDYYFGNSFKADRTKALGFQMAYVDLLPNSYPQKKDMLSFYEKGLSTYQMSQAKEMSQHLIAQYNLGEPFTEEQLAQAYVLRDASQNWQSLPIQAAKAAVAGKFQHWIEWIDGQGLRQQAISFDNRAVELAAKHQFPIVYGQVIVKGIDSPEMVSANIPVAANGFFVAHPSHSQLVFSLPGYKTVTLAIDDKQQVQSIAPVILEPLPSNKQTGVVGRVLPWHGSDHGNILLRSELPANGKLSDPWKNPVIPLTVTNAGEFYTTGLAPGRYNLLINTAGLSTVVKFVVKKGEIRGLSVIDLQRRVRHQLMN